jgi:hypothetical protein
MNSLGWIESIWRGLRYGARLLRRSPSFALVGIRPDNAPSHRTEKPGRRDSITSGDSRCEQRLETMLGRMRKPVGEERGVFRPPARKPKTGS